MGIEALHTRTALIIFTLLAAASSFFMFVVKVQPVLSQAQGSISQEVAADETVPVGTLVSLSEGDPSKVVLSNFTNSEYLFGVVTTTGQTLAEIASSDQGQLVTTTGDTSVVVSTIYGDITAGDVVGVSEVKGIGAKANQDFATLTTVGVALEDFNTNSATAKTVSTVDEKGEQNEIVIGAIPVRLAVNNFYIDKAANSNVLLAFGETIIGRPVSQLQTLIASATVLVSIIVGGIIIWNAVHGGFISMGRNPLSGTAVFNGVLYITILSIAIMVGGFVCGYLILLL